MPGCVLHVSGEHFDVDAFLAQSSLQPYQIERRGSPTRKPGGVRESMFKMDVSDADGELKVEVTDAIKFLHEHGAELTRLATMPEVTDMRLDFGYYQRDVAVQYDYLPPELLMLAGSHRIGIELSLYPVSASDEGCDRQLM